MQSFFSKTLVVAGAGVALGLAAILPAGGAYAGEAATGTAAPSGSATAPLPRAGGSLETMIVLLRPASGRAAPRSLAARAASARAVEAPLADRLESAGAEVVAKTSVLDSLVVRVTSAEARALAADPAVERVVPNVTLPGPAAVPPALPAAPTATNAASVKAPCGTKAKPELDPEALGDIEAPSTFARGIDGAGVTVAFLAGNIDTGIADLKRNAAYASAGSPKGSPVITKYVDFSGDGTSGKGSAEDAIESFGDAGSIAAQGNTVYDLSKFVNAAHALPKGCDIRIVGAAPGSRLEALDVYASRNMTTMSGFLQAIDYAVKSGAKVINESFGGNPFPDQASDLVRAADDTAVAAGVTVVVSTGDGGPTSTIGSPASDPNVISVGASTTFRAYAQSAEGGFGGPAGNGRYVDNNISSFSSSGFTQSGRTVDLVAPGDLNWSLCTTNTKILAAGTCDMNATPPVPSPIQLFGGTSEAAPLTAGAASDVIQAYRTTHGGRYPAPALVKEILTSSATDIDAPADEQGAGLLNVYLAVHDAESVAGSSAKPSGGVLVGPGQVNVVGTPGESSTHPLTLTNTGTGPLHVDLSTRALAEQVGATVTGSFCMQPSTPTRSCPANTGSFPIWSGVKEVYEIKHFQVPATKAGEPTRLRFAADYQLTGQTSLLHVALIEPNGTYAGYTDPQGTGDYAEAEVANPPAGSWTAVFFTERDGAMSGGLGTKGTVDWSASTSQFAPAGIVKPASLVIPAGRSATATLAVMNPASAGDSDQSVVVKAGGVETTVPVTIRTTVPATGGSFAGVLTGGNGRAGSPAQSNSYFFDVPKGKPSLDVSVALAANPGGPALLGDELIGFLVDPAGNAVGYSSNYTITSDGNPESTRYLSLFHADPVAGPWTLDLEWANPVTGDALAEPFTGTVRFGAFKATSTLPHSASATVVRGKSSKFSVKFCNSSPAPEAFFADPRLAASQTIRLPNIVSETGSGIVSMPNAVLEYVVPTQTTRLEASVAASMPITFALSPFTGDPLVSPAEKVPGVSGSESGGLAHLTLTQPEISQGLWTLIPAEIGPYPAGGEASGSANVSLSAVTQQFDKTVTTSTGDAWEIFTNQSAAAFSPVYLAAGACGAINVGIAPTAPAGTLVSGTLYVDDYTLASAITDTQLPETVVPGGDELLPIPYRYKVGA